MRATNKFSMEESTICVPRDRLPQLLGCGQATADRIAIDAGARIKVGKRVLIKLHKLQRYLDSQTE
ncbi:DUF6462 family protein [Luxibacter massiliensis]|uniref:DUF6462 family protein n=1 Tax=Luxibacter massiliensis TaxID=2219695 RepID=UPI000F04BEE9|nr:DUF6462 family protein [Luxibacter massiliensis]